MKNKLKAALWFSPFIALIVIALGAYVAKYGFWSVTISTLACIESVVCFVKGVDEWLD